MARVFSKVLFNFLLLNLLSDREALKESPFSDIHGLTSQVWRPLDFCCLSSPSQVSPEQGRGQDLVFVAGSLSLLSAQHKPSSWGMVAWGGEMLSQRQEPWLECKC